MLNKLIFGGGFAAGYLFGTRAGRTRYDALMRTVRGLKDNPSLQSSAGVVQAQAAGALGSARRVVTQRVVIRVGGRDVTSKVTPRPFPAPNASSPLNGGVQPGR